MKPISNRWGGGNIISNIKYDKRYYYDKNYYLVEFWKALKDGWEMPDPYSITREIYNEVWDSFKKKDKKYSDYYYGYMSFIPSYNGKMWGSFARSNKNRNYCKDHTQNVLRQLDSMRTVIFNSGDYSEISVKNCLIYCDPPYKDSKKNYYDTDFNYENFYNWLRHISKDNKVYISETQMPDDFTIVWEKEYKRTLAHYSQITTTEKLYTLLES